ncbi:MAG: macro domain-containing protein [Chlamydiales bacterium]|nr:macro domain-containing protein [Chlamydiales bacterium]
MDIRSLYNNPNITGEAWLTPFKKCSTELKHNQEGNIFSRVTHAVFYFFATAATFLLVPVGMLVKWSASSSNLITAPPLPEQIIEEKFIIRNVHEYPKELSNSDKLTVAALFPEATKTEIETEQSLAAPTQATQDKQLTISLHPEFSISIRGQDLFASGAEVIVNAANTHLGGGGGIDGLIHKKGAAEYSTEHRKLQTTYKASYIRGHAAIIDSGELKAKGIHKVIVVAGPEGPQTDNEKENALYSCYYNSCVLAHQEGIKSIAFPSISTGIFRYPQDKAAQISLRALHDFIHDYPDTSLKTISIHFLDDPKLKENLNPYKEAAKFSKVE